MGIVWALLFLIGLFGCIIFHFAIEKYRDAIWEEKEIIPYLGLNIPIILYGLMVVLSFCVSLFLVVFSLFMYLIEVFHFNI